jgi:hypothetical protein
MNWLKLTEATTTPRPTWINLAQFRQIAAGPDGGTRLYTSEIVRRDAYKSAANDIPEFFYGDVIESPEEIVRALRKRADHGADERREEKTLAR